MVEKDQNIPEENEMSFLDHLESLRWHLVRSVVALIGLSILAFLNKSFVFDTVIMGPKRPEFWTYRMMCSISEAICIEDIPFIIMNINMSGQFTNHIFVSLIAGFVVAFPYICWEMWRFVKPALYVKESTYARGIVFFSSTLFIGGVLFGYYIIAPLAINFLGSYQVSEEVVNQINLGSYMTTIASISLACGIVFQLPVLTYFLAKVGLIGPSIMRKYQRHSFVVSLILAAIITPPDIISQILVALPLLLLYQVSIFIAAVVEKRNNT